MDSGLKVCAAGVYTEMILSTPAKSKWIQLRVVSGLASGEVEIAKGLAGSEIDILHWSYGVLTSIDIGNIAFELDKGLRLSLKPSSNITTELHYYY